jgi:hypothetical protein
VLVTIIRKQLKIETRMSMVLHILSVSKFDKMPLRTQNHHPDEIQSIEAHKIARNASCQECCGQFSNRCTL